MCHTGELLNGAQKESIKFICTNMVVFCVTPWLSQDDQILMMLSVSIICLHF